MNTEAPLDICCNHGETIAGKLDRVIGVLEDIRDARQAKSEPGTGLLDDLLRQYERGIVTAEEAQKRLLNR